MGGVNTKEKKEENEKNHILNKNDTEITNTIINFNNNLFITQVKNDPYLDYIKINLIGEGSFAKVLKVKHKITGAIRAMKIIQKNKKIKSGDDLEIINEINILRTMDHPNILKIFEFYISKESYFIITELCSGGELFQEIIDNGPFDEKQTSYIMYQIFSAVNYCHKINIIHRDLKPENILIVKREKNLLRIKICDFGTSKIHDKGTIQKKIVGSSYYIAPEILEKKYNEKCDLWSCGVILYILLSGKPPFEGIKDEEILEKVRFGKYNLNDSAFNNISNEAKELIQNLLIMDYHKRINAEDALNNIWFKKNKSKELFNEIKDKQMIEKFIKNLKEYKSESVIQETALAYLVHNFPQIDDIVNACKLFNLIDINGDGKITKNELFEGLNKKIKSNSLKKDIDIIFKNIDSDNNGYIEYEEFVRAAIDKEMFLNENILKFAFRYFDKDNSGEISYEEIEEVFKSHVQNDNVHQSLSQIISEVDTNGDGIISFDEFVDIMQKLLHNKNCQE
jgi:calcium-dependent protein kinase